MRILSVTETYAPFWEFGGPPVKVGALARGLVKRGHEVTVLTADWGFEKRSNADDLAGAERSPFGWRSRAEGVTAIYLPTWWRHRAVSWNPAVKRYCRARLQDFDVVHIYGLYDLLGPAVAAACVKQKIPYVLEPIGMYVPIVRSLRMKRIYHALYGRRLLAGASAIVATAEQEAKELATGGLARERIVLRRNGVEPPMTLPERGRFRGRLGIAPDEKMVLFLGRLSEKKSPDLLLRSFGLLPKSVAGRNLRLVFVGPNEHGMRTKLERMASELGLTDRIAFSGTALGDEKWAAYRDADLFVLPSQNENFGNTAAESVVAGTPVVVTERCGIAPLLKGVAGLVTAHDAQALAKAIGRVFEDADLRAKLVAGCASVAAQLSWQEPIGETEALYNTLANHGAQRAKFDEVE